MSRQQGKSESNSHKILKQRATETLKEKGYLVFTEFRVKIEGKTYIVDVAGFKDRDSIAIECGRTKFSKIMALRKKFNKVKRLFYTSKLNPKRERRLATQKHRPLLEVAKIHAKGRVQIPKEVRQILNLKDGDKVYFIQDETGTVFLEKAPTLKRELLGKYR